MIQSKLYSYILVCVQFTCITLLIFLNPTMFYKPLCLAIFALGIVMFVYILYNVKTLNFNIIPEIKQNATLVTTGVYKYIRHPMYFALFLTMLSPFSANLNTNNLFLCVVLVLALFLKAKKEEMLWAHKSDSYKKYMQHTKMFLPFIL
ncbi:methyltransferase family protein [Sulfurospirillum arcachonense]|uniref:methyltransferase family protein n=1 Tax=Sulfurospirillum arcachonense TaxID=57666 RepID=UPI0012EB50EC